MVGGIAVAGGDLTERPKNGGSVFVGGPIQADTGGVAGRSCCADSQLRVLLTPERAHNHGHLDGSHLTTSVVRNHDRPSGGADRQPPLWVGADSSRVQARHLDLL